MVPILGSTILCEEDFFLLLQLELLWCRRLTHTSAVCYCALLGCLARLWLFHWLNAKKEEEFSISLEFLHRPWVEGSVARQVQYPHLWRRCEDASLFLSTLCACVCVYVCDSFKHSLWQHWSCSRLTGIGAAAAEARPSARCEEHKSGAFSPRFAVTLSLYVFRQGHNRFPAIIAAGRVEHLWE